MKNSNIYISSLLLLICITVLSSCATTNSSILTDYDREADFNQYRTFFWSDEFQAQNGNNTESEPLFYNTLIKKRLKKAIKNEMEGRGYVLSSENPDLLINSQVVVEERNGNQNYAVHPYHYSYFYGAPYYRNTDTNKEGDLVIELIDKDQQQLVWQGYAKGVMEMNTKDRQEEIRQAVSLIFAEYGRRASN